MYFLYGATVDVTNCKITGNGAGFAQDGINIFNSDITLSNCLIEDSAMQGVECSDSSTVNIYNSSIQGNGGEGIKNHDCNIIVHNCFIKNNNGEGIYNYTPNYTSYSVTITNNTISGNNDNGIYSYTKYSNEIEIKNNLIYSNGAGGSGDGIYIPYAYPVDAIITNNTIAKNNDYGIHSNYATDVSVSNCIIWGNGNGSLHKDNDDFDNITYSCIQGGFSGTGNINYDPCFVNDANDNYHIGSGSPCIDRGDPNGDYDRQTDIDGEPRVTALRIDMGADELYRPKADFDKNDIVNFIDYAIWVVAWQTDDPNMSLDDDNDVDIDDLAVFCDDWLWLAPWSDMFYMASFGEPGGFMSSRAAVAAEQIYPAEQWPQQITCEAVASEDIVFTDEQIQKLIDWTEQLWESDPDFREAIDQDDYNRILDDLKQQLKN